MCVYVCFIEKMTRSPNKHGLCCKLAKTCSEKQSCLVRNTCLSRSAQSSQHIPVHYFECEMFDSFRHFECETFDRFRRSPFRTCFLFKPNLCIRNVCYVSMVKDKHYV